MELKFYNTLSRSLEEFKPVCTGKAKGLVKRVCARLIYLGNSDFRFHAVFRLKGFLGNVAKRIIDAKSLTL